MQSDQEVVTEEKAFVFWLDDEGMPVVGFKHEGMLIADARKSMDGQYGVDPTDCYGISEEQVEELAKLNGALEVGREAVGMGLAKLFAEMLRMFMPNEGTEGWHELKGVMTQKDPGMSRAVARVLIMMLMNEGRKVEWENGLGA